MNRKCAKVAITFDHNIPDKVEAWDMAVFPPSTPAPGWPTHLKGAAILVFLAERFGGDGDTVILDHWPTHPMMQVLRACCPKTRFLLYVSIDAVPLDPAWALGLQEYVNTMLRPFRLLGTDGQPVNVYHGVPSRAPVHSVNLLQLVEDGSIGDHLRLARDNIGAHGWFSDSMVDYAYYGNPPPPNAPPREDRRATWPQCVSLIRSADPNCAIWGNVFDVSPPEKYGLDVVYFEAEDRAINSTDAWKCTAWTDQHLELEQ